MLLLLFLFRSTLHLYCLQRQVVAQRDASVENATMKLQYHLGGELLRLRDLARYNPAVSENELSRLSNLLDEGTEALQQSRVVLNGLRIIVVV